LTLSARWWWSGSPLSTHYHQGDCPQHLPALAAQQYYVYTNANMITGTWQPYVKNDTPNTTFDYGSRAAALWLER